MTNVKITNFAPGIGGLSWLVRYDAEVVGKPEHKFYIGIRTERHIEATIRLHSPNLYGMVVTADPDNNKILVKGHDGTPIEIECWEVRPPINHRGEYMSK